MRRLFRQLWGNRSGATAVEFAMVVFPFFLVVFGTIEFGRAMWTRETLHAIAISGARCMGLVQSGCGTAGTYDTTNSQTIGFVQSVATQWGIALPGAGIAPVRTTSTTCGGVSDPKGFSQITLSYDFKTAVPLLISALVPLPLTVSSCFPNQT